MKLSLVRQTELFDLLVHLCRSGYSLRQALAGVRQSTRDAGLAELCGQVEEAIRHGQAFGPALARRAEGLSPLVRSLLQVAEDGGDLKEVLGQIHSHLEQARQVRERLRGAMAYPVLVLAGTLVALGAMAGFVVPAFGELARGLGGAAGRQAGELAAGLNLTLVALGGGIGLGILALGLSRLAARRLPGFRDWLDRLVFGLPGLGEWNRLVQARDFAFCLEQLSRSGRGLVRALRTARDSQSNSFVRQRLGCMESRLAAGHSLSRVVAESGIFPADAVQWLALGEWSGRQVEVFSRMYRLCQERLDRRTARLVALAEPVMTLVLGGLMLVFVLLLVVPLLGLYGGML